MNVGITFLGGAQCVTGSKYLLEIEQVKGRMRRLLVDCGLFQGLKELRLRNREPLPVSATDIETVIITHAHIDHTGYLPKLYSDGFRGRILCTPATQDLMEIMLLDSAKLLRWLANFSKAPKRTFIVHGEEESSQAFARTIERQLGWQPTLPEHLESVQVLEGI